MKPLLRRWNKILLTFGALSFCWLAGFSYMKSELLAACSRPDRQPPRVVVKWLPGYNESFHQQIPDMTYLKSLSWPEVAKIYHSYIENIQIICGQMARVGHLNDGGWEVCTDPSHRPTPPCLVYSFGIGDDFSFDDEMAGRYGCSVHSFDPSLPLQDHQRSLNVTFHNTGLSHYDRVWSNWRMRRLGTIMHELGHGRLDIVKLDIEQWEWKTLPDMLASGRLDTVSQLLVEFHVSFRPQPKRHAYLDSLVVLRSLHASGFRIFYTRRNLHCTFRQIFDDTQKTGCHEVHMIKIK